MPVPATLAAVSPEETESDYPLDRLWKEYGGAFHDFDDLTLARWLAQTLAQLKGRAWRASHPLLRAFQLAAESGHERQVWLKRLASTPSPYVEAACCRAPALPLVTRDVREAGLICLHCSETLVAFDDIPEALQPELTAWAAAYAPIHQVAHWDDRQRKGARNYDQACESAAQEAERLLAHLGGHLAPKLLEFYPAVVWEDQDECLEVRPEDIPL
ncbi:MAG: hypothetical protein NTZ16_07850 [Verrucomicrobia bacterium]|nr:hypothetical protein [Verrucomicrobiota bacterium]